MSDDLISRKTLLDSMDKRYEEKFDVVQDGLAEGFVQMEKLIKEQPTAYDVDKVIEQLEENAKYFQNEANELAQKGDWGTATDLQGRATAYRDAAEIIKSGGVSNGN